ncbi:MAG TPA: universal stress protein [Myxococcales bacterium]|nr:universal stress protein [Myxococcales bacterium]
MTIICGTDGSPGAAPGVTAAAALAARLHDPDLLLLHVLAPEAPEEAAPAWLEEEAARTARSWGVAAQARVTRGDPGDALVAEAQRSGALLVVSCTGHRDKPLLRVGGTAERVAEQGRVPTLVVLDAAPFEEWAADRGRLRVVLGLGNEAADAGAMALVKKLHGAGACDVVAATVYDVGEARARYGLSRERSRIAPDPELEKLIERDLAASLAATGLDRSVAPRAIFGLGRKGDHLLEFAAAEKADLLVVGAHHKGWLRRLSSVSSVALHFRHCSVACIPAGEVLRARAPIHRVLAATDLSPAGDRALAYGFTLLGEGPGEIHLVHVVEGKDPGAERKLKDLAAAAQPPPGVTVLPQILRSSEPARAICAAAERAAADVVCIGSHGRSALVGAVLGSVALAVLRGSTRPVLVVPPAG